jgi:HSP20 family molecular chaperone IbpA
MPSISSFCHPVHMILTSSQPALSLDPSNDEPQHVARNSHRRPDIATPNFDVHETEIAYFLEGEFPGIADKNAITLEQVGPRTLMIETKLANFDLASEWGLRTTPKSHPAKIGTNYEKSETDLTHWVVADQAVHCEPTGQAGRALVNGANQKDFQGGVVRDMVSERRVRHLQRSFTFLTAVDFDGLEAKFAHGLLKIKLMKSRKVPNEYRMFSIM